MKLYSYKKVLFILLFSAVSILGLFTAILYIFPTYHSSNTSALSYQTESNISFTFSPMISISVSSNTIDIPTLAPGTTAESDPITVTVGTNTAYGYSLYADVGNSTDYNTDSLVHSSNDNSSNNSGNSTPSVFTSIATNASLSQLDTDNTWGYSFKPSNESTWSTYNGLPLYSTTDSHTSTSNPALLIDTKDPGDNTGSIDFKIAARSSSTQPSGIYNNVINFYAVGKPAPVDLATAFAKSGAQKTEQGYYRMQDMTTNICDSVEMIHSTIRLQDVRDNQIYTVAKLKDNNCWMTENLNLAGGTEITSELSDVPEGYTLPVANGFQSGNRLPKSSQSGFNDSARAYLYNTNNLSTDCSEPGCYGYYSWVTATVGSGLNIVSGYADAPYSICPKSWRLPRSKPTWEEDWQNNSDYYGLSVVYDFGLDFNSSIGPNTVPNFIFTGYYSYRGFDEGEGAYLFSSTSGSGGLMGLSIYKWVSLDTWARFVGMGVRCLAK